MEEQIFCDGIGRITIIGGVVRLDLFTYSPSETDANGNPRPVLSHRIVMGAEGFLRSSEKVVEAVQTITRGRAPQPAPQPGAPQGPQSPPQAPARPATQAAPPSPPQPPAPKIAEPPPPARPPFP